MPNNTPNTPCLELVIYKIKSTHQALFQTAHTDIAQSLAKLPGFLSLNCYPDIQQPNQYSDHVLWANQTDAITAFNQFQHLPKANAFLACIETVVFSSHFEITPQ